MSIDIDIGSGGTSTPPELLGRAVSDVVVRLPKTLSPDVPVGQVRAALEDDHVHMLLLTDRGRLVGTLVRGDVPDRAAGEDPALPYAALEGRTVGPDLPADEVRRLMLAEDRRRLAVVDGDGSLLGLLCLKRRLTGFCSDADVASRAAERTRPDRDT
ncbi:MAG TPA: CBS domain-containing protein [Nocardioides sp.]|jgi:CBS domain-containing protein|nr:CBS domain-containing protein [Nocardioides sp.]